MCLIQNNDVLSDREKKLAIIRELRLIDDAFFAVCFDNDPALTQWMLSIILNRDDLTVTDVKTQYSIKGLGGHSAVLDALATDRDGKIYNIEVQKPNEGAIPQRARFYGSLIDSEFFQKGQKYSELCETYVIFITENDILKENLPIYHIDRVIHETGTLFDDGSHIIYVNASYVDSTPLGELMHDFMCSNPVEMHYAELTNKTTNFKEEKGKWEDHRMCQLLEDYVEERSQMYKARAAEAEAETAELKARAAEAEAETAEAEARAETAEARAAESEAEAAEAEARAETAEARAETAEAETAELKAKTAQIAFQLVRKGFSEEESSAMTGVPVEEIRKALQA